MNREPIRCFEGSAKPHEAFWRFVDQAGAGADAGEDGQGEAVLEMYGYISEYSWFEDDVTPKLFRDDLRKYGKGGPVLIRMNSYGGDVIAASVISSIIREYPGRVTVQIDGVAASAATVVALAGERVRIQDSAYFMIHDPLAMFFMAALNIEEMSRMVSTLKAVKEGIINVYEGKTGMSRERLGRLMTDETWMDAQRALDLGFVDEIIRADNSVLQLPENAAVANAAMLRNYGNVPAALRLPVVQAAERGGPAEPVVVETAAKEPAEVARLRAEIKLFKKE